MGASITPARALAGIALIVGVVLCWAPPAMAACAPRSSGYSAEVLGTGGVVGYWRLGEGSGTVACASAGSSGSYRTGTTVGFAGALAGDPDTAASFNGSGGSVSVANYAALAVGDRFSVDAWVRRGSLGGRNQVVAAKQNGSWVLMFNPANQLVLRRSTVADVVASTRTVADTSSWHHVAATKDGPNVHLYLDGVDVTGTVSNQTMANNTSPLAVGQSISSGYLKGTVDEVAVYNVALSAAQVADHYRVGIGTADPVIGAAGDIACAAANTSFNGGAGTVAACRERYTSNLLMNQGLTAVLPLGDNQYESGAFSEFTQSYDPTWGRVNSIAHPVPGNHEYGTSGAAGYFDYFNGSGHATGRAGDRTKGYYSYDIGTWHLIALNSNCAEVGGCSLGSAQEQWLKADLAQHSNKCTLAYWHHPRFNSGYTDNSPSVGQFWQDLYDAGADLVLNGHSHDYERFAPQDPLARPDPTRGLREFIVGTGGEDHHVLGTIQPNSELRNVDTFGVLRLRLRPTGYSWRFAPEAGASFTDSGSGSCH